MEREEQQPSSLTDDEWRVVVIDHARSYVGTLVRLVPFILLAVALIVGLFQAEPARHRIVIHHVSLAILALVAGLLLRRRPLPDAWALPALASFGVLFAELMFFVGFNRPEARVDAMTFAVLIAFGFVVLSLPWLAFILFVNVAALVLLAAASPAHGFDSSLGIMMLTAVSLSLGLQRMRVESVRRLELLVRRDRWSAEQVGRAKEAAEAANRAKSEFLADMSHEIRNPLSAVIGGAILLQESEQSPEQRDLTNIIRRSSESLLGLINDILDFSKIESGRLELENERFDLIECVESAVDLVSAQAVEKGLDLALEVGEGTPRMVSGDSGRLRQILLNLLANAVKFTERGEVVLSVDASMPALDASDRRSRPSSLAPRPSSTHCVRFRVRDTGIGIPPDRAESIFESFSQGDASTSRRFGGTGLGLAISRRLCEAMGGEIHVDSDGVRGSGSTFSFWVRLGAVGEPGPVCVEYDLEPLRGKRLLIADANDATRRSVARQARAWGMIAIEVDSTRSAADAVRSRSADVAIVDAALADSPFANVEQNGGGRPVTAILMSTVSDPRRPDPRRGFVGALSKPVKQTALYSALAGALDGSAPMDDGSADERERRPRNTELRILVAEDDPTNRRLIVQLLGRLGYRADVAVNGVEALAATGRQRYDVVLMDMMMPEMDGLDATRAIRETRPPGEQPHIIAVTANVAKNAREQCLEAGMDDYLSKPISSDDVRAALDRAGASLERQGRGARDEGRGIGERAG